MTHTPMPWKVEKHSDEDIRITGKNVTIAENFTEADAAFIVRAVNAHEELITAGLRLRNEAMHFMQTRKGEEFLLNAVTMLQKAIDKAEGRHE